MFPKVVKYIVLTCIAGVILFLGSVYFLGLFTSSDYTSFTKIQIEKIFEIQLPSYKVDSIWRRESFTHDIFEYQELQFDSMNQREWTMFLNNIKSRIGDTTMMDITVHKYSKSYPRIDGFNGGYGLFLSKDYEEASFIIDTLLYRGYFKYKSY